MFLHRATGLLIAALALSGCAGARFPSAEKHYFPTQVAEFYLCHLPSAPMEPSLYRCLSRSTREMVPFASFASYLSACRPPGMEGGREGRVTIANKVDLSDSRSIIYAVFQWPPPSEDFFLVRIDCRLEGGEWRIEFPRFAGAFRPIDVIFEGRKLDKEAFAEVGKVIAADRVAILKDLEMKKKKEEMNAVSRAREGSITELFIFGKECYNNGRYRRAMTAFSKALRLDPENDLARDYIAKCREALKRD